MNLDFWRGNVPSLLRGQDAFSRFVEQAFQDWASPTLRGAGRQAAPLAPSCDLSETKTHYHLKFDLPGLTKDQIKVDLHDGTLTVSGERREERKEDDKDGRRHLQEVYYGSFMRSFTFPTAVDAERVEAKYDSGVLSIAVPKADSSKARQISVR